MTANEEDHEQNCEEGNAEMNPNLKESDRRVVKRLLPEMLRTLHLKILVTTPVTT